MKMVNFVLGLATAIILAALITLGIKAFYAEPVAPTYPASEPILPAEAPCPSNDAVCQTQNVQYEAQQAAAQAQYNADETAYEAAMQVYDRNVFIIGNVVGIIVFAVGFWLVMGMALASQAVPVGIMLAGLWSIIYGYGRGWGSVDDQLKFFIGLVVAVIVIGGSMWLMQRNAKKSHR
jgi:heme/copper-type cytochrome/quinol oxidase subunit 4